eukprot:1613726-Pleurochrysis_carterae.AAC.1
MQGSASGSNFLLRAKGAAICALPHAPAALVHTHLLSDFKRFHRRQAHDSAALNYAQLEAATREAIFELVRALQRP